jgi:TPR repeat protein
MRIRILLAVLIALVCAVGAWAQSAQVFVPQTDGWRVQLGDDPAWASPSFDDSSWTLSSLDFASIPRGFLAGRSRWYRKRIHLPDHPGAMQILVTSYDGSYDAYVDGRRVSPAIQSSLRWRDRVTSIFPAGQILPRKHTAGRQLHLSSSVQFAADQFDSCKYRVVGERGKRDTMNSRSCRWMIVSALVIAAPIAWAQCAPVSGAQNIAALKQQADQGKATAQCSLGVMYDFGYGVPQDYAQAAVWFRKAAKQGNAEAEYYLGSLYDFGKGVPQDDTQAALWYRKAADQGDADAQENLGDMYLHGQGVPQDAKQAAAWYHKAAEHFRKAAEQGDAYAQSKLGYSYDSGKGVPQDDTQAALWYRKAAEQGYAEAELQLGHLYLDGHGVPQDAAKATAWYRKAAEQGDNGALCSLGDMYLDGKGVPQDFAEAYFWLDLAAVGRSGDEWLAKHRDEAASHLTPADLSREQERARKWFEAHPAKPQ